MTKQGHTHLVVDSHSDALSIIEDPPDTWCDVALTTYYGLVKTRVKADGGDAITVIRCKYVRHTTSPPSLSLALSSFGWDRYVGRSNSKNLFQST